MASSGTIETAPAAPAPPLPADAIAGGAIAMTLFVNMNSGVRETTLPVPTRPRDMKAVESLLAKLRIVSAGRCSSTVFGDAFRTSMGRIVGAGGFCYRVEFATLVQTGGCSSCEPGFDAASDTVWFMGGFIPLVVFCARKKDAGGGRARSEIDSRSPVLMWVLDSVPHALRAISRLWSCCETAGRGASGTSTPADGDAFDDLGSDYEEHLVTTLSGVPYLECKARVAGIRTAYCAAHGLPTAPIVPSASVTGAGEAGH